FTKIDSTVVKGGLFEFKNSKAPEVDLYFIELDTTKMFMYPMVLEKGEIKFSFDKANQESTKVTGTKNNDLMTSYNEEALKMQKEIQKEMQDFEQQNQAAFIEAQQKGDQLTIQSLREQVSKIQEKYVDFNKNFISTNKDSYISLLLLTQLAMSDALTTEEIKNYYNAFDASVKDTKKG